MQFSTVRFLSQSWLDVRGHTHLCRHVAANISDLVASAQGTASKLGVLEDPLLMSISYRLGGQQSRGRWLGAFGRATCQQPSAASGDVRDLPL